MTNGVNIPGPLQNISVFLAGAGESVSSRERNTAGTGTGVWDHLPVTTVFSMAEANRPPFRLQTTVRGGPLALLYLQAHMPEKIHIRETENRAIWPTVLSPVTSAWLQVNFEPPGVCTALFAPRYPRCIKHVSAARLKAGLSRACKSSLEAESWLPGLHSASMPG